MNTILKIFYTIVVYDHINDEIHHECDYPLIRDINIAHDIAEYVETCIDLSRYHAEIAEYNCETLEIKYV